MSSDIYSLSLTNLALDGSLELFLDLYRFTYNVYLKKLQETPSYLSNRDNWNAVMIPEILPEFESLAFKRLRMFTTKIKILNLYPHHFKGFDFFDKEKIKHFEWKKRYNQDRIASGDTYFVDERYVKSDNSEFEFHETVIDLQVFVNHLKLIMIRAIREETQKEVPSYSPFDARRDVDARIAERMRKRQNECVVPSSTNHTLTEKPLFVFSSLSNTACKINQHRVVSKKYYARHIDGQRTVVLPVHHCENCDRYMIGALSLSFFKEYSGKFIAQITKLISDDGNEWNIHGESKLHKLGYNVINGKLSAAERQNILISLAESKQLTFFEITATIEQNIRVFENTYRMQNAVIKWRSDLQFINAYMINKSEVR